MTVSGHARRPDGQIPLLVLGHLQAHPQLDFSPYELAKALRVSHGTIRRHLLRLAAAGRVRRTRLNPARFQITT
jgi:predicted ArsR family transcriptional regulator